jgi:hypothetical protein
MLTKFKKDPTRDLLVPALECYMMDLSPLVNTVIAKGLLPEDFKYLASWAKAAANPKRAKGLIIHMAGAMFAGKHNHDELNIDFQTNTMKKRRVAMMYLPDNIKNIAMNEFASIMEQGMPPGIDVLVMNSTVRYRGKKIKNENAEAIVKDILYNNKSLLIISSKLAQRSFSIPEVDELYLAYDKGAMSGTKQKSSRVLTANDTLKVGRVFSLSFDRNRDDKFESMIIDTALNIKQRKNVSINEGIRMVLRTMDIFSCQPNGAIKFTGDDYLQNQFSRSGIIRAIGKKVDINKLDDSLIAALASGNINYMRAASVEASLMGETYDKSSNKTNRHQTTKPNQSVTEKDRMYAKAREKVLEILENLDIIIYGTNQKNINAAMQIVMSDLDIQQVVEEEFGVPAEIIFTLISTGAINQDHVDIIYEMV